jgi:hypothetical protein
VLKPGGRLVIVDFAPHQLDHLRAQHAHRRLGFSDAEISGWMEAAGLTPEAAIRLPGTQLTVSLWPAAKPLASHEARPAGKSADKADAKPAELAAD